MENKQNDLKTQLGEQWLRQLGKLDLNGAFNVNRWMSQFGELGGLVENAVNGAVNEIENPHQMFMGLEVRELDEKKIKVVLPNRWRNRSAEGVLHRGAIFTLAEFTALRFWQNYFELREESLDESQFVLTDCQCRFFGATYRQIYSRLEIPGEETDRKVTEFRVHGETVLSSQVIIEQKPIVKLAEFNLTWKVVSESYNQQ